MPTAILGLDLAAVVGLVLFLAWLERRDRRGRHRGNVRARPRQPASTKTARHVATGRAGGSAGARGQEREPETGPGDLHRNNPAA